MKHSFFISWLVLASLCALNTGNAADRPHQRAFSQLLLMDEWPGAAGFVAQTAKPREDLCGLLKNAAEKYAGTPYVERRIVQVLTRTRCSCSLVLTKKFLDSESPLLREAAVALAMSLPDPQRNKLRARVLSLKRNENDPAVLAAIAGFLDTSDRRIASPKESGH